MAILRLTAICGLKSSNGLTTPIPLDEWAKLCPDTLLTIVIRYGQIVRIRLLPGTVTMILAFLTVNRSTSDSAFVTGAVQLYDAEMNRSDYEIIIQKINKSLV